MLVAGCAVPAGADSRSFRSWGVAEGLSQSQATAIVQDREGFLWIGTRHGLSRFDSHRFETFSRSRGLPSSSIGALLVDHQGTLWAGLSSGTIVCRRPRSDFEVVADLGGHGRGEILHLVEDGAGNLWALTRDLGAFVAAPAVVRHFLPVRIGGAEVLAVHSGTEGLWLGTARGLYFVPRQRLSAAGAPDDDVLETIAGSEGRRWTALLETRSGALWAATGDGELFVRHASSVALEAAGCEPSLDLGTVTALAEDGRGWIWIGTRGSGAVALIAGEQGQYRPRFFTVRDALGSNEVEDIFVDREGQVWLALNGGGVAVYRGRWSVWHQPTGKTATDSIWSIWRDEQGEMWFGSRSGLVHYRPDPSGRRPAFVEVLGTDDGLCGEDIRGILGDGRGGLWLATADGGLCRFDPDTRRSRAVTLPGKHLLDMAPARDGGLWLSLFGAGVVHLGEASREGSAELRHFPLARRGRPGTAFAIAAAADGGLWASVVGRGLVHLPPPGSDRAPRFFGSDAGWQGSMDLSDLLVLPDRGVVYLASFEGDLGRLEEGRFTMLSPGTPLENDGIFLLESLPEGEILVGTNRGLFRFDVRTRAVRPLEMGAGRNGTEANLHAVHRQPDGSLWVGTVGGVLHFDPEGAERPLTIPQARIRAMEVDFETRPLESSLELPADVRHIAFDFTAISTTAPEALVYQYRLDGGEASWIDAAAGTRVAYTGLAAGHHRFSVRARIPGSAWSRPAELEFTILAPFWQRWWFVSGAVLVLLALGSGALRWRLRVIRQHTRELEAYAERRTRQLEQLNRDLRKAVEARSRFLATVSHEIRTPMNGVMAIAQLLEGTELNAEQQELVELLGSSGRSLMTLLNGVLDLSKLEAGGLALDPSPIDPRTACEEVIKLFAPQAAARGIILAAVADPEIGRPITVDEQRLRQVLGNLVGNAVKFTDSGHVMVRIGSRRGDCGQELLVEVLDSGCGIAEEETSRLFEPFFQQAPARGRPGGSGLGLAICKGLVEAMGGRIGAARRESGGSCFWLTLPADQPAEFEVSPRLEGVKVVIDFDEPAVARELARTLDAFGARAEVWQDGGEEPPLAGAGEWILIGRRSSAAARQRLEVAARSAASHGRVLWVAAPAGEDRVASEDAEPTVAKLRGPLLSWRVVEVLAGKLASGTQPAARPSPPERFAGHVLVVDDNPVNLEVASRIVQRLGCRVSRASDGRQALEVLESSEIDLVLMDCQMPVMDGYEATREIRRRPRLAQLPVIAVTAATLADDREHCGEAGMNDYLSKPISAEGLARVLRRWLCQGDGS